MSLMVRIVRRKRCCVGLALLLAGSLSVGCTDNRVNPSFPVTISGGQSDLKRIAADRRKLDRPIVVLGGFADPGIGAAMMTGELRRYCVDPQIVGVSFLFCDSFNAARRRVVDAVESKYPSADANATVEVDVIGMSMGGVVGRFCALPAAAVPSSAAAAAERDKTTTTQVAVERPTGKRLRIRRLFTISSPHLGALEAARFPGLMQMQVDLRPDSEFLRALAAAEKNDAKDLSYELIPYVRLDDRVVGPQYAAPAGRVAWWVPNVDMAPAHVGAMSDPRILADIVRRLRNETPLTTNPPAPLPSDP